MTGISADGMTISHFGVPVIRDITLSIDNEELLGTIEPSESGNSNRVRAIAGSTGSAMESHILETEPG